MFPQQDLLPNQYLLPLRMTMKIHAGSLQDHPDQEADYGSNIPLEDLDPVSSFLSLLTHEAELVLSERLELAVSSLLMTECLLSIGFLEDKEMQQQEVALMMFRYQARVRCNAHQVDRQVVRPGHSQVEVEGVASAVFPLLPLLNHSCDHNTLRVFSNNMVTLLATR